jgi:aryl-alcohol dehydrogenase-like predicted oxidoreductase
MTPISMTAQPQADLNNTAPSSPLAPWQTMIGNSELKVSRIGLGCWPMAGITSIGVSDEDSVRTVHAAMDQGINFFDTAYAYGYDGRSDKILRTALQSNRPDTVIAHKVGTHWGERKERCVDGTESRLIAQAEECLVRLKTDYVDLIYLHAPDPSISIEESAGAIAEICRRGWARYAGVSNVDAAQAARFHAVCPIVAIQPYFNMFQQESVHGLSAFARSNNISMVCFWILMKGLLSGSMQRDHVFDPSDRRLTYPIYRGDAWQRAQDVLDRLRAMALEMGCTVSQLVIAWSLAAPGVSVALVGAKRPEQIVETAQAMHLQLTPDVIATIDGWIQANPLPI